MENQMDKKDESEMEAAALQGSKRCMTLVY